MGSTTDIRQQSAMARTRLSGQPSRAATYPSQKDARYVSECRTGRFSGTPKDTTCSTPTRSAGVVMSASMLASGTRIAGGHTSPVSTPLVGFSASRSILVRSPDHTMRRIPEVRLAVLLRGSSKGLSDDIMSRLKEIADKSVRVGRKSSNTRVKNP